MRWRALLAAGDKPRSDCASRHGNAPVIPFGKGGTCSYPEKLAVARLDLLALRQHQFGIGLQQLEARQRRTARLLLGQRMERATREHVDEDLLRFHTEQKTLKQPRGIRSFLFSEIGRAHV